MKENKQKEAPSADESKMSASERLETLRLTALAMLKLQLLDYRIENIREDCVKSIEEKKTAMIEKATTKKEIEAILHPKPPHYNGAEWICDEHLLPEEEAITWSRVSLTAPLNTVGTKRYLSLMKQLLPNDFDDLKLEGLL